MSLVDEPLDPMAVLPPPARDAPGSAFRSLRVRNFRLWFVGQGISQMGYFSQTIALAVFTLNLTDNGTAVGIVTSVYFLPILVVGPWAGVVSDRVDKRRVLLCTQTAMMAFSFLLGILALGGWATYASTVVVAVLNGIAGAFDQPPRRTIVTELVDEADGANAIALNTALNQAGKVVGPAVAGVLVSTVGVGWCFVANGVSSLAVIGALLLMDPTKIAAPTVIARTKGQIADGFRYAWSHADIRLLLAVLGALAAFSYNWTVILPILVERDFQDPTSSFAVLMTAMSVGSFLAVLRLARHAVLGLHTLAVGGTIFGLVSLVMAVIPNVILATPVMLAIGMLSMILFNGGTVALQLAPPPSMRGRVMAIYSMVVLGAYALGGIASGWMAEVFGARPAIVFGGVTAVLISLALGVAAARRGVGPSAADVAQLADAGDGGDDLVAPLEVPRRRHPVAHAAGRPGQDDVARLERGDP